LATIYEIERGRTRSEQEFGHPDIATHARTDEWS